jgi:hypothetical protein
VRLALANGFMKIDKAEEGPGQIYECLMCHFQQAQILNGMKVKSLFHI